MSKRRFFKSDGQMVLASFLAFFFVFCAVDVFFVYKAISTMPGVVSENAYEIGLNYNKVIAEAKRRQNESSKQPSTPATDHKSDSPLTQK